YVCTSGTSITLSLHHILTSALFFILTLPPPRATLFPYTTLFRSRQTCHQVQPNQATYQKRQKCQPATYLQEVLYQLRSEERFSRNAETDLVCRLLLEKKKTPHSQLCRL